MRTFDVAVVDLIDYGSDTQRESVEMVVHCGEEAVVPLPHGLIADSARVGACAQARGSQHLSDEVGLGCKRLFLNFRLATGK